MSSVKHFLLLLTATIGANGDGWIEPDGFPLPSVEESNVMSCHEATETIRQLVQDKRLSATRLLAQNLPPECEKQASNVYVQQANLLLETLGEEEDGFQQLLTSSLQSDRAQATMDDAYICSIVDTDVLITGDYWEKCCSSLWEYSAKRSSPHPGDKCLPDGIPVCCEFFQGSPSHLRLPVLRELAIRLRVMLDDWELRFINLEQDGFLRPYDMSTVQWPAGYFLSLCVAAPIRCGIPELETILKNRSRNPVAIELGSGIGASSIALAMAAMSSDPTAEHTGQPLIISTDNSPQALALTTANVAGNNLSNSVKVQRIDHFDMVQVKMLKESYFGTGSEEGFSLVLGSSLLSFFVNTSQPNAPLWQTLNILLHSKSNTRSLALLVHTKLEPLHPPSDGSFRLVRRISGDVLDMQTRSSASSDFELSIFERCDIDCLSSDPLHASHEGEL